MRRWMSTAVAISGLVVSGSPAFADVFTFSFTPGLITDTVSNYNVNTAGATGRARAFHVNGNWTANAGNPFSNELVASLTGVTDQGNGVLERFQGGLSNGNPFVFGPPTNTTSDSGFPPEGMLANIAAANLGGNFSVGLRQSLDLSSANLTNASISFYTDVVAPVAISFDTTAPTFVRPDSLTTTEPGDYHFQTSVFTAQASGAHHFGLYTNGLDGYLAVYEGSFDPLNPLTNLIGLDDDGDLGTSTSFDSSSFWLNLTAGTNYVSVVTTFAPDTAFPDGLLTIAGPIAAVPEPTTIALMGVIAAGGVGMWYRRRQVGLKQMNARFGRQK